MDAPASTGDDQAAFWVEPGIFEGEASIRIPGKWCGVWCTLLLLFIVRSKNQKT